MIFDRFSPKILTSLLPAILLLLIVSVQPVGSSVPFVKNDVIPIIAHSSFSADTEYVVGTNKTKLLQFVAGGHVLAFGQGGMSIAAPDHALKIEFVGARPVYPVEEAKPTTTSENFQSTLPPLGTVTYPDLWEGISLVYEKDSEGLVKCTYRISPITRASQLDQIRLAYSVPVRMNNRGQLLLKFKTGQFIETVPVAWQEIGGEHIPVNVSFSILGENEVGFKLGTYDPVFPIVIDPLMSWNRFMGSADHDFTSGITGDRSSLTASGQYASSPLLKMKILSKRSRSIMDCAMPLKEKVTLTNMNREDVELFQGIFDYDIRNRVDPDDKDYENIMHELWERLQVTHQLN